jgi:hypothetical protein
VAHNCIAGCTTDAQCAMRSRIDRTCDMTTGQCVECTTASDCPTANSNCVAGLCVVVPCSTDAQCSPDGGGDTPFCLGTRCVQCENRGQCPAGARACTNNVCVM